MDPSVTADKAWNGGPSAPTEKFGVRPPTRAWSFGPIVLVGIAALIIVGVSWMFTRAELTKDSHDATRADLVGRLGSLYDGLEGWADDQRATAALWAANLRVEALAAELTTIAPRQADLLAAPAYEDLREMLRPVLELRDLEGYFLIDPDGTSVGSMRDENTGTANLIHVEQPEKLRRVLDGEVVLTEPQFSDVPLIGADGMPEAELATMFVGAPVRDGSGAVIAALFFRIDPYSGLGAVLEGGTWARTGEAYAFDDAGRFLSPSRFEGRLVEQGVLDGSSVLALVVRVPSTRAEDAGETPLTLMAADAVLGGNGVDVEGYTGYLGDTVVGAWEWNADLGFGLAIEQAIDEADAVLQGSRSVMDVLALVALLLVLGLFFLFSRFRRRLSASQAVIEDVADRLGTVVDQTSDGIIVTDATGAIVLFNKAAIDLFGYRPEEVLGRPVDMLVPPDFRTGHEKRVTTFVSGNSAQRLMAPDRSHVLALRSDGDVFPAAITLTSVELSDGDRVAIAAIRDQTSELAYQERLVLSNRDLERFASIAAHDLQEPLRKVQAFAGILREETEGALDGDAAFARDRIIDAVGRMRLLVDDLLDYSRVTASEASMEPLPLESIAHDVLQDLAVRLHESGGSVVIEPLVTVSADRGQVTRLFLNLLANGLKFSRPGEPPQITVSVRDQDETCEIVVEDNGIGFDPEHADRIFEAFRRLHSADEYQGTGMGLAICRRIVEHHDWTLSAESTLGAGARFIISIPRSSVVGSSKETVS